jgi:hypothetical protein
MFEVRALSDEFGFRYNSVIGMLIFLMNTFIYLHFPISKLAKFMVRPGRKHFEAAAHILRHLRCNVHRGGLKYFADPSQSPFHLMLAEAGLPTDYPLTLCTDSSWQDCPDTGRSTGCYLIFCQGGVIDGVSFVPDPVAMSSSEGEFNVYAFAIAGASHTRQIFQELHGLHADTPLTIPLLSDSQSGIAMANSERDTHRTRHIQRRYKFTRQAVFSGLFIMFKILGTLLPADLGTKLVDSTTLDFLRALIQVDVPP